MLLPGRADSPNGVPDDILRPWQNPLHTAKRQSFASVPTIGTPFLPDERRLSHTSFSWFVFTGFVCLIVYIIFYNPYVCYYCIRSRMRPVRMVPAQKTERLI